MVRLRTIQRGPQCQSEYKAVLSGQSRRRSLIPVECLTRMKGGVQRPVYERVSWPGVIPNQVRHLIALY